MTAQKTRDADEMLATPTPPTPDLQRAEAPIFGDIPWGYGHDRVTAMPVDPYWLFVYWELTEEAIERARSWVGATHADCVVRVYDTTYRLFDGTNANWHVDVGVYRPANNHYVHVGRPGATLHVAIGVPGPDGRFATIACTAPVEMPRDSIASDTRVEWMTVTPAGAPPPGYAHRFTPRTGPSALEGLGPRIEIDDITRSLAGEGFTRLEWSETEMGGRTARWVRWSGPFAAGAERWRWLEPGGFGRVEIVFEGERRVISMQHGERVVVGPWRLTIHGLDPRGGHRVIDRWEVRYSWATGAGALRIETGPILLRVLQGYRTRAVPSGSEVRLIGVSWASEALQAGASEWQWLGASEARLAGASEVLFLGASERHWLGASELILLGASEVRFAGASELLFIGASERELSGASQYPGASEYLLGGASERPRGGASEFPGAGDRLAGGGGAFPGAGERRPGGASEAQGTGERPEERRP